MWNTNKNLYDAPVLSKDALLEYLRDKTEVSFSSMINDFWPNRDYLYPYHRDWDFLDLIVLGLSDLFNDDKISFDPDDYWIEGINVYG